MLISIILGLIVLDIAIRLYLISATAVQVRSKAQLKKQQDRDKKALEEGKDPIEEDSKDGKKRVKSPSKVKVASQAAARAALVGTLRVLKFIQRIIRWVISALFALIGWWGIAIIVVIVSIIAVVGYMLSDPDMMGTPMSGRTVYSSTSDSSNNTSNSKATMPEGLDPEAWKQASSLGQEIASNAVKMISDPPNGESLKYSQTIADVVGWYDCGRFASMAWGMAGVSIKGETIDPALDYKTQPQSIAMNYSWGGTYSVYASVPASSVAGTVASDYSNVQAGDYIVVMGHAVIALGKGTDGKYYLAHASSPTSTGSTSPKNYMEGNKNATQVVVTQFYDQLIGGKIIRPSLVFPD